MDDIKCEDKQKGFVCASICREMKVILLLVTNYGFFIYLEKLKTGAFQQSEEILYWAAGEEWREACVRQRLLHLPPTAQANIPSLSQISKYNCEMHFILFVIVFLQSAFFHFRICLQSKFPFFVCVQLLLSMV
jgi:hypothetical protein